MISAHHFSPLSFSPVGEMQVTLVLSKPCEYMLLFFDTTTTETYTHTLHGTLPIPTEEVRWGLMSIAVVNSPFPCGRLGLVALGEG